MKAVSIWVDNLQVQHQASRDGSSVRHNILLPWISCHCCCCCWPGMALKVSTP